MTVPIREKLAYGLADTATMLTVGTTMNFLLYYYTEVFGVTAAAAGTLFLCVRLTDGLLDVLVGVAADRTRTRWGRFRPWVLGSAGPLCLIAVLVFTRPDWGSGAKLLYAWITYLLLMAALSALTVPLGALSAAMTADTNERTALSGIRAAFSSVGTLIVSSATLPLIKVLSPAGADTARGYQYTMAVYAAIAFLLLLITFSGTRERILPPARQRGDLSADLSMLKRNGPWMIVTATGILMLALGTLRGAIVLYYFRYYAGDETGATLFLVLMSVGGLLGALLCVPLARRLGKRLAFQWGALGGAVCFGMLLFVPPGRAVLINTLNLAGSLAVGCSFPLVFSMLADTTDYGEWKCGRRSEGIIFSGLSVGFKAGTGLGGVLAGVLLAAFGYAPSPMQTASSIRGIVLMMSAIPALGYALAALSMKFYSLDEHKTATMRADLERLSESPKTL